MFHIIDIREQNVKDNTMLPLHKSVGRPNSDKMTAAITKRVNANKRNSSYYDRKNKLPKRDEWNGVTPNDGLNKTSSSSFSLSNNEQSFLTTKTPSDLTGESNNQQLFYRNDEYGNNDDSSSSDNESLAHHYAAKNENHLANNNNDG